MDGAVAVRLTVPVTDQTWQPDRRDAELRKIKGLTTSIVITSVGLGVAFSAGIAWADQKTSQKSDTATTPEPTPAPTGGITPPSSKPTASPTAKPKTKSGGS